MTVHVSSETSLCLWAGLRKMERKLQSYLVFQDSVDGAYQPP